MANNCYFDLHVRGSKEGIEKMIQAFEDEIIGRVYNYNIYDQGYHKEENVYYVYIDGDCAWSIQSAMLDKHKIQEIIYVYRLDAEAYSEEIGIGFMEHYLYEYGELIKDECRDFFSFYIEDIELKHAGLQDYVYPLFFVPY